MFAWCVIPARAEIMPDPLALPELLGAQASTIQVFEPHLTVGEEYVAVDYVGYPADTVLNMLFGASWPTDAEAIEFRALDGYVSRIPVEWLQTGKGWLVFQRGDGADFTVDNPAQNQLDVPLGPYYLVWDNMNDRALLSEGAHNWPYQVSEIVISFGSDAAMRPVALSFEFDEAIELTKTHCLSCHQVNGYGGSKFPGNLAQFAKIRTQENFVARLLDPRSQEPFTSMPALDTRLPEDERHSIAEQIYAYLASLPVAE
jgi:hypothetical protein